MSFYKGHRTGRRDFPKGGARWAALLLLALVGAGCIGSSGPTYPRDIFREMHYAQSYRVQEPPRLDVPEGAVPITGREVTYTQEEAKALPNPYPRNTQTLARGQKVFQINCVVCHGAAGKGDGPVADYLVRDKYNRPPNLTADPTLGRTDGEIFFLVTKGIFVMPSFRKLLTEEERWAVVHYMRTLQGK
ncbi:MAG: cytochrome c [Chloroflexi bacterium]|nr:cytochrome c [Chloroflexota bacterium]